MKRYWIINTHDPKDVEGAKRNLRLSMEDFSTPDGRERAWQRHLEWLEDKAIGDPQATPSYTVEELKQMGVVGVYVIDEYSLEGKDAKELIKAIRETGEQTDVHSN